MTSIEHKSKRPFRIVPGKGKDAGKLLLTGGRTEWQLDNVSSLKGKAVVWRVVENMRIKKDKDMMEVII